MLLPSICLCARRQRQLEAGALAGSMWSGHVQQDISLGKNTNPKLQKYFK
jgi:hypothetical protein